MIISYNKLWDRLNKINKLQYQVLIDKFYMILK